MIDPFRDNEFAIPGAKLSLSSSILSRATVDSEIPPRIKSAVETPDEQLQDVDMVVRKPGPIIVLPSAAVSINCGESTKVELSTDSSDRMCPKDVPKIYSATPISVSNTGHPRS